MLHTRREQQKQMAANAFVSNRIIDDFVDEFALNIAKTLNFFSDKVNTAVEKSVNQDKNLDNIASYYPRLDFQERDDGYHIHMDIPGMTKNEVQLSVSSDNVLTISGDRVVVNEYKDTGYLKRERIHGKFSRSVKLPNNANVDNILASMEHGVLHVTVAKSSQVRGKRIHIS